MPLPDHIVWVHIPDQHKRHHNKLEIVWYYQGGSSSDHGESMHKFDKIFFTFGILIEGKSLSYEAG